MVTSDVPGSATWRTCGGASALVALLTVTGVLVGASFQTLAPTELGLDFDSFTKHINEEVLFENGRWFIGPAHWFIRFPKDTRSILFVDGNTGEECEEPCNERQLQSMSARTADGLVVALEVSYQYRLQADPALLASLYRDFGYEYELAYIRESRDVLRTAASRFVAFDYFYNRTAVAAAMQEDLTLALSSWHANVEAFQLLSYSLPSAFALAIEDMEVSRQQVETMELQRSVADIDAQTRLLSSEYSAGRTVLAALRAANATLLTGAAQTTAVVRQLDAEAEALVQLREEVGLSELELQAALWLFGLRQRTKETPTQTILQMTPPSVLGRTIG